MTHRETGKRRLAPRRLIADQKMAGEGSCCVQRRMNRIELNLIDVVRADRVAANAVKLRVFRSP